MEVFPIYFTKLPLKLSPKLRKQPEHKYCIPVSYGNIYVYHLHIKNWKRIIGQ